MEPLSRFSNTPVPFKNHFTLCPYVFVQAKRWKGNNRKRNAGSIDFFFKGKTGHRFRRKSSCWVNGPWEQDWLHNLQESVQNENVGLLVQIIKNFKMTGEHDTKCGAFLSMRTTQVTLPEAVPARSLWRFALFPFSDLIMLLPFS